MAQKTEESTEEENVLLWETLTTNLNSLENNLTNFVEFGEQFKVSEEVNQLAVEISKLQENMECTLDPFWQQIKDEMFDLKYYIKQKDEELRTFQTQCQSQELLLKNTQNDLKIIKSMLYQQSSFTAILGSTLSSLLWKASKEPYVVESIITGNKITDFFETTTESIRSFFEAFEDELPEPRSNEMQFIISLLGVVANIAAVPSGRQFMTASNKGEELIRKIIQVVPKMTISGIYIERIMLMVLFNVSIDTRGILFIENDIPLLQLLVNNIFENNHELIFISLKLLQSITYEIKNEVLFLIRNMLPVTRLRELEERSSNEERKIIIEILQKLYSVTSNIESENVEQSMLYNDEQ